MIPWLVLQEIDYATKKNDLKLSPRAKAANTFIFEFLKKKHPRLFGQSLEDFKNTYKNAVSVDDCILQYCLKFVSLEKNVVSYFLLDFESSKFIRSESLIFFPDSPY